MPLKMREKDLDYQYYRIRLFRRLLFLYPSSREQIIEEAKIDIPPLVRAQVWAAILGVQGDYQAEYDLIDKESENQIDRQV
jgi:TBC domain-containing protein kinase-like protein